MLTFWIIAAVFTLFALWFVLPPLLQNKDEEKTDDLRAANVLIYQDQFKEMASDLKLGLVSEEQYLRDKEELERRMLDDLSTPQANLSATVSTQKVAYVVGLVIPIGVIAFYLTVGNRQGLEPALPQMAATQTQTGGPMTDQAIAANVEKLAKKLEENPNDAQGWIMLGRSYYSMERFGDAASAYEHATKLNANDAALWADYAESSALANGQNLAGEPTEAVNRALQIDPKNQKALYLAGSAAYQAGDYKKAIEHWQNLLTQFPAGSQESNTISEQITKAKELARGKK